MTSDTEELQAWRTARPTRFRAMRAYVLTVRILSGYAWLRLWRPAYGAAHYDAKLIELHRRNSTRIVRAILDLGGLFIKVGQLISILTNFLPPEFRSELGQLQDRIPARPFDEVRARIRKDFGRSPEDLFAEFDPVPIASASLAQVHAAVTHEGKRVAVKVQHADIEEIAALDLVILDRVLRMVGLVAQVRGLESYHGDIANLIRQELDFTREAQNIALIRANFSGNADVRFPVTVPGLSTQRVLTTEFVDGTRVGDMAALAAAGIDRAIVAQRILRAYCQMIFVDGVFHADPHPGNILVHGDNRVTFLDFGAVGTLSPGMKAGVPLFWDGVIRRDSARIMQALNQMGLIARDQRFGEPDVAERVIDYFQKRFLEQVAAEGFALGDIRMDMRSKIEALTDLRELDVSFRSLSRAFQLPREWVIFERTTILLLGLATELDPNMNPVKTVEPYLREFVLGPETKGGWGDKLRGVVKSLAMSAVSMPDNANRFFEEARQGDIGIQVQGVTDSALLLYAAVRQAVLAFLAVAAGALAYGLSERGLASASRLAAAAAALLLAAMLAAMWRASGLRTRLARRR